MPTLNWIGKEAVVKHHHEVPFHLLKDLPELACGDLGCGRLIGKGHNLFTMAFFRAAPALTCETRQ